MAGGTRRQSRRTVIGAAALGALAAALSACDAIQIGARGGRIKLGISPGNQTLWRYLVARNNELLRSKSHLVDFINVSSEDELQTGLINGTFDVIATLIPAVPKIVAAGTPVRFFLPIAWLNEGYPLIVAENSPIRSLPDAAGRRLATFPVGHPGFAYWQAFLLKHYGLRGAAISTNQSLEPHVALANGEADAAFVAGAGWAQLKSAGGYRKVADLQGEFKWLTGIDRVPMFAGFVAKNTWIEENQRFVTDLVGAARQSLDQYKRTPSAFMDIVTSEPAYAALSRDENIAIATYLGYDAVNADRVQITQEDIDDYRRFLPLLVDSGVLPALPGDPADLFYIPKTA